MRAWALLLLALSGCSHQLKLDAEREMILRGPADFVRQARVEARKCGYKDIALRVNKKAEKVAESNLELRTPQAECFGDWIAAVPDATFEVVMASVVS